MADHSTSNPAVPAPASAPTGSGEGGGANKRAHERTFIKLSGIAYEHGEGEVPGDGIPCEISDISRSGVGIKCRRMMYAGKRVFVFVPGGNGPGQMKMLYGEVRYSRYTDRGMYHVGVKFTEVPRSHGLPHWIEERLHGKRRR